MFLVKNRKKEWGYILLYFSVFFFILTLFSGTYNLCTNTRFFFVLVFKTSLSLFLSYQVLSLSFLLIKQFFFCKIIRKRDHTVFFLRDQNQSEIGESLFFFEMVGTVFSLCLALCFFFSCFLYFISSIFFFQIKRIQKKQKEICKDLEQKDAAKKIKKTRSNFSQKPTFSWLGMIFFIPLGFFFKKIKTN